MWRDRAFAGLTAAALLASCHRPPPPIPPAPPHACRVGPDGGPLIADRGIGGTGGPAQSLRHVADRGIGGTGIGRTGIVGTGIVGVITGFGSICLAGQEVALPADTPVTIDARPTDPAAMRAGQVAIVDAAEGAGGLSARRVEIRYEVIGPVASLDGDRIEIAGQTIVRTPQTLGAQPRLGEWTAVSGLRQRDGVIVATRLEPIAPGPVLIHGVLATDRRVGALPVGDMPQANALLGQPVTVSGAIADGRLVPLAMLPDLLVADPGAYFGPSIATFFVEGYGTVDGGRLRVGPAFSAPAPEMRGMGTERGVFRFERAPGGLRAIAPPGQAAFAPVGDAPRYAPAPMPNGTIPTPNRASPPPFARGASPRGGDRFPSRPASGDATGIGPAGRGGLPR